MVSDIEDESTQYTALHMPEAEGSSKTQRLKVNCEGCKTLSAGTHDL